MGKPRRLRRGGCHQTGGSQPPTIYIPRLRSQIARSNIDLDQADSAISAAIENDDVFEFDDRLCLVDDASLTAAIEWEVEQDEPRRELIARCNRLIDSLQKDPSR